VFESSWVKIAKKLPAAVGEFVDLLDNNSKFEGLNPGIYVKNGKKFFFICQQL
jgi:hypothetical protein